MKKILLFIFVATIPLFLSQCSLQNARPSNTEKVAQQRNFGQMLHIINNDQSVTSAYRLHDKYITYTNPKEFGTTIGYVATNQHVFMTAYLKGENEKRWTQSISVLANKAVDMNAFSLEKLYQGQMGFYTKYCVPTKISSLQDFSDILHVGKYESMAFVLACGEMISKDLLGSLETFHVNIKVPDGYYSIIWSERGPNGDKPITINKTKWVQRFRQLEPVGLYDHFPPRKEDSSAP